MVLVQVGTASRALTTLRLQTAAGRATGEVGEVSTGASSGGGSATDAGGCKVVSAELHAYLNRPRPNRICQVALETVRPNDIGPQPYQGTRCESRPSIVAP